ncbi:hypothetical protein PQR75_44870 [Paraburkholderia fungorum]|jgi:aconitase A|uniref:hypothetical protein n=1 Tax=Paraburkholderia fungorum TaxID=134537 RepID=UPI0038BAE449
MAKGGKEVEISERSSSNKPQVRPLQDLAVDHSLNVEVAGTAPEPMAKNMAIEKSKNAGRFEFPPWCKQAFTNLDG